MVEAVLFAVFLGAAGTVLHIVGRKIPLLLQVPGQLIEESFVTRPSYLRRRMSEGVAFFREERHRELYFAVLVRLLHGVRLWLLRLERIVFRMLEALQTRDRDLSLAEERYWSELKQWKQEARVNGNPIPEKLLDHSAPDESAPSGGQVR